MISWVDQHSTPRNQYRIMPLKTLLLLKKREKMYCNLFSYDGHFQFHLLFEKLNSYNLELGLEISMVHLYKYNIKTEYMFQKMLKNHIINIDESRL